MFLPYFKLKDQHYQIQDYLSKNCDTPTKNQLANILNIKISDNFGKYLGFPILTHRPKTSDLHFIIDNMNSKIVN